MSAEEREEKEKEVEKKRSLEGEDPNIDGKRKKVVDPYINGGRNKKSDFRSGFLKSIVQMIIFIPIFYVALLLVFLNGIIEAIYFIGILYIGIFSGLAISLFIKRRRYIIIGKIISNASPEN